MNILDLFRVGKSVADPATWKNRSSIVLAVSGIIVAVGNFFPQLGLDASTANAVGVTVATIVGLLTNITTSDKVGILPAKPDNS